MSCKEFHIVDEVIEMQVCLKLLARANVVGSSANCKFLVLVLWNFY
jgi:hypothetical protein